MNPMKVKTKDFENSLEPLIRKRIMSIQKPYTAKKIAQVNSEDNFILYFAREAEMVMIEEFIRLDDNDMVSTELLNWFNESCKNDLLCWHVPVIRNVLKKIYAELEMNL